MIRPAKRIGILIIGISILLLACAQSGWAFEFRLRKKASEDQKASVSQPKASVIDGVQSMSKAQAPSSVLPVEPALDWKNKYARLEKEHVSLQERYDHLKDDRDNVLAQTRVILKEKNKLAELVSSTESIVQENKDVLARHKELERDVEQRTAGLIRVTRELQAAQATIDQLQGLQQSREPASDRPSKKEAKKQERRKVRELRESRNALKKEKKELLQKVQSLERHIRDIEKRESKELLKTQKKIAGLERVNTTLEENGDSLRQELAALGEAYDSVWDEKESLADEFENLPVRFSEMARQNEKLIKETASMHYNLGVYYSQEKEYRLALNEFRKVLELDPDDTGAHYNLGYIYAEQIVERTKAIAHFEKFLELAPDDKDAEWVRRYLLTWQTYYGAEIIN